MGVRRTCRQANEIELSPTQGRFVRLPLFCTSHARSIPTGARGKGAVNAAEPKFRKWAAATNASLDHWRVRWGEPGLATWDDIQLPTVTSATSPTLRAKYGAPTTHVYAPLHTHTQHAGTLPPPCLGVLRARFQRLQRLKHVGAAALAKTTKGASFFLCPRRLAHASMCLSFLPYPCSRRLLLRACSMPAPCLLRACFVPAPRRFGDFWRFWLLGVLKHGTYGLSIGDIRAALVKGAQGAFDPEVAFKHWRPANLLGLTDMTHAEVVDAFDQWKKWAPWQVNSTPDQAK